MTEPVTEKVFIGRTAELATLKEAAVNAFSRRGGAVFIEGGIGLGKTTLLERLQDDLELDPRTAQMRTVVGYCYEHGTDTPFSPFVEALSRIATQGPERRVSQLTLDLIREVGPDLLRALPVVGEAAAAGVKAVTVASDWWLGAAGDQVGMSRSVPQQFSETVLALAQAQGPLVLMLEDLHWADAASAQLLLRLAQRAHDHPLLIVGSYRREEVAKAPFYSSIPELVTSGRATLIALEPFTAEEVTLYLNHRYGDEITQDLSPWIMGLSGGQPLFVADYLALLETKGAIQHTGGSANWHLGPDVLSLPVPRNVAAILEARLARLQEDEHRILQLSAVQGQRFYAALSASLAGLDEMEGLKLLQGIARREQLVSVDAAEQWSDDWSDVFSFANQLIVQTLYDQLSPRQKALLHRTVGESLAPRAQSPETPVGVVIEAARHLSLGKVWGSAAPLFLRAAQTSYDSAAFTDTTSLCERALSCLANISPEQMTPDLRGARSRSVQLLLLASELRWWGATRDTASGQSPQELLNLAQEDAAQLGDLQLQSQLTFLRARVAVIRESLPAALLLYEAAVEQAQNAGDALGEVVTLIEMGHHRVGVNVQEGLATLKSAYTKWQALEPSLEQRVPAAILARHLHRLQGSIGVAEFDIGRFDIAESWLRPALDGLRHRRMPDLHSVMANFLAQLYTASGRFEEAMRLLLETLEGLKTEQGALAHRGYNRALLGKLYLEWGRLEMANAELTEAYESTQDVGNEAVMPLIRNYYCELLIHPSSPVRDYNRADTLLHQTLEHATQSGFLRSAVAAHMLLARSATSANRIQDALEHSKHATQVLEEHGTLPALRSEEVFFARSVALRRAGQEAEASTYLNKAVDVVRLKAASLSNESMRYQYLNRIPLNRLIQESGGVLSAL